jgi:hypothetical protein
VFPGACARRQCETSMTGYLTSRRPEHDYRLRTRAWPRFPAVSSRPQARVLEPLAGYVPATPLPALRDQAEIPAREGARVAGGGFEPPTSGL